MKKINENQKVTLTLGQLKRLVRENTDGPDDNFKVQPTNYYDPLDELTDKTWYDMYDTVCKLVKIYGRDTVDAACENHIILFDELDKGPSAAFMGTPLDIAAEVDNMTAELSSRGL